MEVLHVLVSRQSQRRENSAGRGRAALATSSSVSFFGFLENFDGTVCADTIRSILDVIPSFSVCPMLTHDHLALVQQTPVQPASTVVQAPSLAPATWSLCRCSKTCLVSTVKHTATSAADSARVPPILQLVKPNKPSLDVRRHVSRLLCTVSGSSCTCQRHRRPRAHHPLAPLAHPVILADCGHRLVPRQPPAPTLAAHP